MIVVSLYASSPSYSSSAVSASRCLDSTGTPRSPSPPVVAQHHQRSYERPAHTGLTSLSPSRSACQLNTPASTLADVNALGDVTFVPKPSPRGVLISACCTSRSGIALPQVVAWGRAPAGCGCQQSFVQDASLEVMPLTLKSDDGKERCISVRIYLGCISFWFFFPCPADVSAA